MTIQSLVMTNGELWALVPPIVRRVDSRRTFRLFMVIKEREDHQKEHVFGNETYCQNALLPQMSLLNTGLSIKLVASSS